LTFNTISTLKYGLKVTQGHWKRYHPKVWVRFPIRLLYNCGSIFSRLWDIQHQMLAWPWKSPGGLVGVDRRMMNFVDLQWKKMLGLIQRNFEDKSKDTVIPLYTRVLLDHT